MFHQGDPNHMQYPHSSKAQHLQAPADTMEDNTIAHQVEDISICDAQMEIEAPKAATGCVSCPFCCKKFASDQRLLAHVKGNLCKAVRSEKGDSKKIEQLSAEVKQLKATLSDVMAKLAQLTSRMDAVSDNELAVIERVKVLEDGGAVQAAPSTTKARASKRTRSDDGSEEVDEHPAADADKDQEQQPQAPQVPSVVPFERASIMHVMMPELARCVRDFEFSGLRKMTEMVYFNASVPKNRSVKIRRGQTRFAVLLSEDGKWEVNSKASVLKRVVRKVLNIMSAKLDDSDVQDQLVEDYNINRNKLEQVIQEIDEAINDATSKKHKRFYEDIWCLMMEDHMNDRGAAK